jgi:hypothetical protein
LFPGSANAGPAFTSGDGNVRRQPTLFFCRQFVEHGLRKGVREMPRHEAKRRTLPPVRQFFSVPVDVGEGIEKR